MKDCFQISVRVFVAALLVLPAAALAGGDGDFTLTVAEKEPPSEIKDEIRKQLGPKSYTISNDDGTMYEFWFVQEVPLTSKEDPRNILNNIPVITLLGIVDIPEADRAYDFRDDPIDPGLMTLRLAMQPQDGNHMGTAPLNTFAILIPYERDAEMGEFPDHDTMVDMSSEDTIAGHPPILYIMPGGEGDKEYPHLTVGGVGSHVWQILALEFTAKLDGDETMALPVHLVFEGVGDL